MKNLYYETKHKYKSMPAYQDPEDLPSLTIQNESMSIQEMLRRHQRGQEIPVTEETFFDEEDLEKIDKFFQPGLDLTDLDELSERVHLLTHAIEKAQEKKREEEIKILEDNQKEPVDEPAKSEE